MGKFKFAMTIIKRNKRDCLIYLSSIILTVIVLTLVQGIVQNENFIPKGHPDYLFYATTGFAVAAISIILIMFTSMYYAYTKNKEFGVVLLSGRSVNDLSVIIGYENFVIITVGTIIGIVFGILILPIIYPIFGISGGLKASIPMILTIVISIMVLLAMIIVLFNLGLIQTKDIGDMMKSGNVEYTPDKRFVMVSPKAYMILVLMPILMPIIIPVSAEKRALIGLFLLVPGMFGINGAMRMVIPNWIMKIKKEKYSFKKNKLIILSNLHHIIRKIGVQVSLEASSMLLVLLLYLEVIDNIEKSKIFLIMYVVIIFTFSIINGYKIIMELFNRKNSYRQLLLLGYSKIEIKKILKEEVTWVIGSIIGLPVITILPTLITGTIGGIFPVYVSLFFLMVFVGVNIIVGFFIYKSYVRVGFGDIR